MKSILLCKVAGMEAKYSNNVTSATLHNGFICIKHSHHPAGNLHWPNILQDDYVWGYL